MLNAEPKLSFMRRNQKSSISLKITGYYWDCKKYINSSEAQLLAPVVFHFLYQYKNTKHNVSNAGILIKTNGIIINKLQPKNCS